MPDKQYISQIKLTASGTPYYIKDTEAQEKINEIIEDISELSGPMHLIGSTVNPVTDGGTEDPQIPDYDFTKAKAGDVVLQDHQEFVWTGNSWELLGDEGSYVFKTYEHVYQPAGTISRPTFTGTTATISVSKTY